MKRDQLPFINNKEISGVGQVVEFKAGSQHRYIHRGEMNQVLATSESLLYVGHEGYFLHLFSPSLLITPGFVSTPRIHIIIERSRENDQKSAWSRPRVP